MTAESPTQIDAMNALCAEICSRVGTHNVGIVQSYNPATRRAQVQPLRMGAQNDGQPYKLPVLDGSFLHLVSGGMTSGATPRTGDTVLIVINDRELDAFHLSPAPVPYPPVSSRTHDESDVFFLPFATPSARPVPALAATAGWYAGREDLSAGIEISNTAPTIRMGTPQAATQPVIRGTTAAEAIGAYVGTIATAFADWGTAGGPSVPANGDFIVALSTATATLGATVASWLSTKVFVE